MTIERKHFALFLAYLGKSLETLRFNQRMHATLFNTTVSLFNEKLGAVRALIRAYRDYVGMMTAQNGTVGIEAKGRAAAVDSLRAAFDVYAAKMGTVRAAANVAGGEIESQAMPLEEFDSFMLGVRANVEVVRQNLEGYREALRAYGRGVDMTTEAMDAYAAQVQAESSSMEVQSANVAGYAAYWRTEQARASAYNGAVGSAMDVFNGELSEFREAAGAQRGYLSALTGTVSAQLQAVRGYTGALEAGQRYTAAWNRASAEWTGAENMVSLAVADQATRQQALEAQAAAEQARIDMGLRAAEATASAGLANAASSVISRSASIRGSAGASSRGSVSESASKGQRSSRNWSTFISHK